jgi:hypothetical protein
MSDAPLNLGAAIVGRHLRFVPHGTILARAARLSAFAARRAAFGSILMARYSRQEDDPGADAAAETPVARVRGGGEAGQSLAVGPRHHSAWRASGPDGAGAGLPSASLTSPPAARPRAQGDVAEVLRSTRQPWTRGNPEQRRPAPAIEGAAHAASEEPRAVAARPPDTAGLDVSQSAASLPGGYAAREAVGVEPAQGRPVSDVPMLARTRRIAAAVPTVYRHPSKLDVEGEATLESKRSATGTRTVSPAPTVHAREARDADRARIGDTRAMPAAASRDIAAAGPSFAPAAGHAAESRARVSGGAEAPAPGATRRVLVREAPPVRRTAASSVFRHRDRVKMRPPWTDAPHAQAAANDRAADAPAEPLPGARSPARSVIATPVRSVPGASIARAIAPVAGASQPEEIAAPRDAAVAPRPPAPDVDEIVERVVQRLSRQVAIEAERRGVASWRSRS